MKPPAFLRRRHALPFFALILACVGLIAAASAHSDQVGSVPAPNSRLDVPPDHVEVTMSTPVEVAQSHIRVFDIDGVDHAVGDLRASDNKTRSSHLVQVISLPGEGTYTVAWEGLDAGDGHTTQGGFAFAVGNASLENAFAAPKQSVLPPWGESAARGLTFVGWLTLGGVAAAVAFVARPLFAIPASTSQLRDDLRRGVRVPLLAGACLAFLGAAFGFMLESGHTSFGLSDPLGFIVGTRVGAVFGLRLLLAAAGLALCLFTFRTGRGHIALAVLSLVALAAITATSHAKESGRGWLMLTDWLHLSAAAIWLGALLATATGLVPVLRQVPEAERRAFLVSFTSRVSAFALGSVIVLALSGTIAALLQVGSWAALLGDVYGQILLLKLGLFALLIVLGALNRQVFLPSFRTKPAAEGGVPASAATFRRVVTVEVCLVALVLLVTGVLSGTPPPGLRDTGPGVLLKGHGEHFACALRIDPGALGVNAVQLDITTRDGKPIDDLAAVTLFLNSPENRLPTGKSQLNQTGPTQMVGNATFGMPGTWAITVYVQRNNTYDDAVDFQMEIARPSQ